MSENTLRLRNHVASYRTLSAHRQNCLDVCDEVDQLEKERDMYKAQVETFRKNAPKLMTRNEDGELIPLDKQTIGISLPMLLDALGAKLAGRDFSAIADQLSEAKDLTDIQKYVLSFLKAPDGEDAPIGDISVMLKSMLSKAAPEEELVEKVTRMRHTHCPHDGQKCRHDCEPGECWRELDGS